MSPQNHVIASTVVSGAFYAATHSWEGTVGCFLSGIFIDIDHHFDLWIYKRKPLWSLKDLYHFCDVEKGGKLHLVFHSYELLLILWVCLVVFKMDLLWWGIAVGMTVHILFDQFTNSLKPLVYFLSYRMRHGFSKQCVFPEEKYRTLIQGRDDLYV